MAIVRWKPPTPDGIDIVTPCQYSHHAAFRLTVYRPSPRKSSDGMAYACHIPVVA